MLVFSCRKGTAQAVARLAASLAPASLLALILLLWPHSLFAGTIHVDGTTCTLPDAISAANTDSNVNGCVNDSPAVVDTILITGTHSFPNIHSFTPSDGPNATPSIISTVVISGGPSGAIVERTGNDLYRLFHVASNGELTLENVTVRYGRFDGSGGAIYNRGRLILIDSEVRENIGYRGGGIFNNEGYVRLQNSRVISNTAGLDGTSRHGGGIYSGRGTLIIDNSQVLSNTAAASGGGIRTNDAVTITNTIIAYNHASEGGGGIVAGDAAMIFTGGELRNNTTPALGGGIYIDSEEGESAFFSGVIVRDNLAASGGAFYVESGKATLTQSCVMGNSDTAVANDGETLLDASLNWWGAADGPGGLGPGAGDSVGPNVTVSPYLDTPILGCDTSPASIRLSKSASPSATLMPGQPLTFTLTITNETNEAIENVFVTDELPAGFVLDDTITSRAGISVTGSSYLIDPIEPLEVVTLHLAGYVDPTLTADLTLENTATLTNSRAGTESASVSREVIVPTLQWSSPQYTGSEATGSATVTVTLTPANPHAPVTVQVVYTDSIDALATVNAAEAVIDLTFDPTVTSRPVVIPIAGDNVYLPRTLQLRLQSPSGASLGTPTSTLDITDDDTESDIAISVRPNVAQATVGDTITYTYYITNTGLVTLTNISAEDDLAGPVPGIPDELAPGAPATATATYTVQLADWPHPLVNTVQVTAADIFGGSVVDSASATVTLTRPADPIPALYLPSVNTKN